MTGAQVAGLLPVVIHQHGIGEQRDETAKQHDLGRQADLDGVQAEMTGELADLVKRQLVTRQAHQCHHGQLQQRQLQKGPRLGGDALAGCHEKQGGDGQCVKQEKAPVFPAETCDPPL